MTRTKVTNSSLAFDSGPFSSRNKIINPAMEISQRGTSFVSPVNGTYTLDRFAWFASGTMAVTISQSTDVPNNTFQNSLRVDVTTADTSTAAGDFAIINQRIEGYNVRDLIGQTFTLSFWVKSSKTGVHCVSFINSGLNRSYVLQYTVSTANTWEFKTVTVVGGLITGGTWDWTNGAGLNVVFSLKGGTTFQTTAGSWQVGDFQCTSNQVNVMDNVNNDFFLTGVQLEIGQEPTPFERRPYGHELLLCQRYYQEIGSNGANNGAIYLRSTSSVNNYQGLYPLAAPMRINPNITTLTVSPSNIIHKPSVRWDTISGISWEGRPIPTEPSQINYIWSQITPTTNDAASDGLMLYGQRVFASAEL
jgi:hypothetical protein